MDILKSWLLALWNDARSLWMIASVLPPILFMIYLIRRELRRNGVQGMTEEIRERVSLSQLTEINPEILVTLIQQSVTPVLLPQHAQRAAEIVATAGARVGISYEPGSSWHGGFICRWRLCFMYQGNTYEESGYCADPTDGMRVITECLMRKVL